MSTEKNDDVLHGVCAIWGCEEPATGTAPRWYGMPDNEHLSRRCPRHGGPTDNPEADRGD